MMFNFWGYNSLSCDVFVDDGYLHGGTVIVVCTYFVGFIDFHLVLVHRLSGLGWLFLY